VTLRLVFLGTPDFSVPTLAALVDAGHEIAAVYTRAPKPAGRGMTLRQSPVHDFAAKQGFPVFTPRTLRTAEAAEAFRDHAADAAVVVAYGLILPNAVLEAPRHGCFNVHASLLPRWRGAAPINRAVMAGDAESGVAIMKMDEGLDTGPVARMARVSVGPDETAGELHDRLADLGAAEMAQALADLDRLGVLHLAPQPDEGVVYAHKLGNEDTRIDWSQPAQAVHDHCRGLSPFPAAWCTVDLGKGPERLKILRTRMASGSGRAGHLLSSDGVVACGAGALQLVEVQRSGKAPMSFADFARGARLEPGARFA